MKLEQKIKKLFADIEQLVDFDDDRIANNARYIIEELKKDREWQPIETAPEDGSLFIGYGKFLQDKNCQCFIAFYDAGGYTEGWAEKHRGNTLYLTHWMPLPKPPVNNNNEG